MTFDIKTAPDTEHLSRSQRMVFDVLIGLHANGHQDATDSEIQAALERLYAPRRFDRSWISGRIADMKSAQLVIESQAKRHDANTRFIAGATGSAAKVRAVYVPNGLRPGRPRLDSDIGAAAGGGVDSCY
mgnify:FL=1|jgi:hypothetical protein